jgi:Zn-dependent peptidase ImmA (M78 family)
MNKLKRHLLISNLLNQNNVTDAPVDVERIARAEGIDVRKRPAEDEISGFFLRSPDGVSVICVNNLHHPNRQRFTIAHELGHYHMHNFDEVHVDRVMFRYRDARSRAGDDKYEIDANRFAAELLMPEEFLLRDLKRLGVRDFLDDRTVSHLARKYQVSVQAMSLRLVSLDLVAEGSS